MNEKAATPLTKQDLARFIEAVNGIEPVYRFDPAQCQAKAYPLSGGRHLLQLHKITSRLPNDILWYLEDADGRLRALRRQEAEELLAAG